MANILVVGASKGIGLEICRQYCERGDKVFATTRNISKATEQTGASVISNIEVTDMRSIEQLSQHLAGVNIDILVHCAGILTRETFNDLDFERIRNQFEVNTLGPLRVVHTLSNCLNAGSRIGILSSRVGSVEDNQSGGNYGYRMSKAAVNMVGKNLSHDLADQNICVLLLHPGLVATEMTNGNGISPSIAATGLINRLDSADMSITGTFWHAEGYPLPW